MTRRVVAERHRIEMLIAQAMVDRQGVVRQLQPDQIAQLICRELAKERARVRRKINKVYDEFGSIVYRSDILAALRDRKGKP